MTPRILRGLAAVRRPPRRAVVTVGVFDGVHLAHQHLLRATIGLAHRLRGTSVAVTFDPDPEVVLHPDHVAPALMPLDARVRHLLALGVDRVWIIPFTRAFARMTADRFVREILVRRLRAAAVLLGARFTFGRGRRGTMTLLNALGPRYGMQVVSVTEIARGGAVVSSSRIRRLLAAGRLAQTRNLLGRPPMLYGVVVRGAGRGRRLGVPTANIQLASQVLPPQGVYAVTVHRARRGVTPPSMSVRVPRTAARRFACGEYIGGGVMNVGVRPTFGPGPLVCEAHLLDFAGTLQGESVSVALHTRLRGERCFASPQALVRQIRHDIRRARRLLARLS